MNGTKVLNQLIKLFVVINVFLFMINFIVRGNQYILPQERIDNIINLLDRSGISVETELIKNFSPKYSANLVFIGDSVAVRDRIVKSFFGNNLAKVKRSISSNGRNENVLYYTLDNETLAFNHNELIYMNLSVRTEKKKPLLEQARKMCMKIVDRIDGIKEPLSYKVIEEDCGVYWKLTYFPVIEGIPVLDSKMEFQVYSDGVAKASMYLADIEIKNDSRKEIYAVDLVLFGIEDYMRDNGYTTISDISLCYKQVEDEENVLGQQIVPVYKIEVEGLEEPIFVNAYTNTNKILE